jgi:phosphoribosylamine--glycine ligase
VAEDAAAAEAAVREMMVDRRFGDAGAQVVVEEFLRGREASFFVVTDGVNARVLPSAEDHKRAFDDDRGPNTGGMGAFSPSPLVTGPMAGRILESIVFPTLRGLAAEGRPYRGFLYCGLMITPDGPKVIEFNARMGDPETQVVRPGLADDLLPHLWNAAGGRMSRARSDRGDRHVGVVLASGGYPDSFETGKVITGLEEAAALPATRVFHAGSAARDGDIVTAGGRVLTVVGRGGFRGGGTGLRLVVNHVRGNALTATSESGRWVKKQKPAGSRSQVEAICGGLRISRATRPGRLRRLP